MASIYEAPNLIEAYDGQASALMHIGQLEGWRRNIKGAIEITRNAVTLYDKALAAAPDYILCLNNKGRTLRSLGMWLNADGRNSEAIESWQEAEAVFSKSLALAPSDERIIIEREIVRACLSLTSAQLTTLTGMGETVFDFADAVKKTRAGEEE